ncbi:hypothetical protein HDU81_001225 [Chytriomyces hyalinus]|nr:hypothetical protein HDU81_001225 [Chytriomyces hyalinus]
MSMHIKPASTPLHVTLLGRYTPLTLSKAALELAAPPVSVLPQLLANQRLAVADSIAWDVSASVYALLPLGCTGSQKAADANAVAKSKKKDNPTPKSKKDSSKLHKTNGDAGVDKKLQKKKADK